VVATESLFERVGGQPFFDRLVASFYTLVEQDDLLISMYPDRHDLTAARRHLALFLGQYWGGPPQYSVERGHPRLRLRHAPFAVTAAARDAWLTHMRDALSDVGADLAEDDRRELLDYLSMAAHQLRNR